MTKQSEKLRTRAADVVRDAAQSAQALLAEAERLDAIYVSEPPVYADGTSVIMFSRTRPGDREYFYAAVRDPKSGAWTAVSAEHRRLEFRVDNWDELLNYIQGNADTKWTIWHGDLEELAASPELVGVSEPIEAPTCEHGQARYSMSISSQAGHAPSIGDMTSSISCALK